MFIWLFKNFSAEGISNEMANYITMALDPNAGHTFALMNDQIGNYQKNITRLEKELETILRTKNITIVDLFHKIAIRCFQFFFFFFFFEQKLFIYHTEC